MNEIRVTLFSPEAERRIEAKLSHLDRLGHEILRSLHKDDPAKFEALTKQLKDSADALQLASSTNRKETP